MMIYNDTDNHHIMTEELHFNILDDLSTELEISEFYPFTEINDLSWELVSDPSREKEFRYKLFKCQLEYDPNAQSQHDPPVGRIPSDRGGVYDEEVEQDERNFGCVDCGLQLHRGCYTFKNNNNYVICKTCSIGFLDGFKRIKSKESKGCDNCGDNPNGRLKWFRNSLFDRPIYLCGSCMDSQDLLKKYGDDLVYLITSNEYWRILVDVSPVFVENLEIPHNIIPKNNELFVGMLKYLRGCDVGNSLLNWVIFTDSEVSPMSDRRDYFAINCEKGSRHEVASVTISDDEFMYIDVLYESFEDYKRKLDEWKMPDREDILRQIHDMKMTDFDMSQLLSDDLAEALLSFAEYVRNKYDLDKEI